MGSHSVCFRCLKFLGSRHPTLVLPLVPELLSTHPFFDTAEPDMDDPACILCWLSRKFWPLFRRYSFGGLRVLDFVFSFSILLVKSICWGNLVIIIFLSFCFSIHSNSPLPLNSTTNFLAIYWIPSIFHLLFKYFIYFFTDLPNNPGRRYYSLVSDEETEIHRG